MIYAISFYIELLYNGTWLYLFDVSKKYSG